MLDAGANEVLAAVARGEADFGLNFIGAQEGELEFKPLLEERFVAACRRDHPAGEACDASAGRNWRSTTTSRSDAHRATGCCWTRRWPACRGGRRAIYEAQHVTTTLGLVEAGLGVAAVPSMAMPGPDHPLAGERAAGRSGRHPQGRADMAPRTLAVAGSTATVRSVRGSERSKADSPSRLTTARRHGRCLNGSFLTCTRTAAHGRPPPARRRFRVSGQ